MNLQSTDCRCKNEAMRGITTLRSWTLTGDCAVSAPRYLVAQLGTFPGGADQPWAGKSAKMDEQAGIVVKWNMLRHAPVAHFPREAATGLRDNQGWLLNKTRMNLY